MNGMDAPPLAIGVTDRTRNYLVETRPWVRLMSVMIFLAAGLLVLIALALFVVMAAGRMSPDNPFAGSLGAGVVALLYLAMALLYVAPGVFLSRYASAIGRVAKDNSVSALEDALKHQRTFWRYVGILTLVAVVLCLVLFAFAFVVGIIAGLAR